MKLERLESRQLLAGDGFLQGYAFIDNNTNNTLDAGDTRKVGSTIELRSADGTTLIASTQTNADGYYRFNGLDEGTYRLVELAPAGFASSGTEIVTSLSNAAAIDSSTIAVDLVDPTTARSVVIRRTPGIPNAAPLAQSAFQLAGASFNNEIGGFSTLE